MRYVMILYYHERSGMPSELLQYLIFDHEILDFLAWDFEVVVHWIELFLSVLRLSLAYCNLAPPPPRQQS